MLFFVIEHFKSPEATAEVYRRFAEKGRMLPDGLYYIDSWVEENLVLGLVALGAHINRSVLRVITAVEALKE